MVIEINDCRLKKHTQKAHTHDETTPRKSSKQQLHWASLGNSLARDLSITNKMRFLGQNLLYAKCADHLCTPYLHWICIAAAHVLVDVLPCRTEWMSECPDRSPVGYRRRYCKLLMSLVCHVFQKTHATINRLVSWDICRNKRYSVLYLVHVSCLQAASSSQERMHYILSNYPIEPSNFNACRGPT